MFSLTNVLLFFLGWYIFLHPFQFLIYFQNNHIFLFYFFSLLYSCYIIFGNSFSFNLLFHFIAPFLSFSFSLHFCSLIEILYGFLPIVIFDFSFWPEEPCFLLDLFTPLSNFCRMFLISVRISWSLFFFSNLYHFCFLFLPLLLIYS